MSPSEHALPPTPRQLRCLGGGGHGLPLLPADPRMTPAHFGLDAGPSGILYVRVNVQALQVEFCRRNGGAYWDAPMAEKVRRVWACATTWPFTKENQHNSRAAFACGGLWVHATGDAEASMVTVRPNRPWHDSPAL